jgi:MYXO-CTERM domain-containing protein
MKWLRIALGALMLAFLVTGAAAYLVTLKTPDTIVAGETLTVTMENNLPGGFTTDLILYRSGTTKQEVARQSVTFQGETLVTTFSTAGFARGTYQVEIVDPSKDMFGGSSVTLKQFTVINRASALAITSRRTQEFDGTLDVAGTISDLKFSGILVTVDRAGEVVFGPEYIPNGSGGSFNKEIPIPGPGIYRVNFTDRTSFIAYASFEVTQIVTPTTTVPTPTVTGTTVSGTAPASKNAPAYFAVKTRAGLVRLTTNSGIDWVMEYIDESGARKLVNERGTDAGEEVTFTAQGGTVYVKVFPLGYADQGTVVLTGQNVETVNIAQDGPSVFGDLPVATTPATPLPAALVLVALGLLVVFRRR